jgi:Tfp pilus assembly protein PilV
MRARRATRNRRRSDAGFTLLEALVAALVMSIAVVGLLSNLSTSMENASRLTEYDQVTMLAQRKMEDLLADPNLPLNAALSGTFSPDESGGLRAGWQARYEPFQAAATPGANQALNRIFLEVWWEDEGSERRTVQLESYRAVLVRQDQLANYPR